MKKFLILLGFIFTFNSYGQQDLNTYSYVVVPQKFSFLKQENQFQLNSLTKFLFEKYGFRTFMEGEEAYLKLNPDRCEGLFADVINDSGLFKTKVNVVLKDCRNQQVFASIAGESKQKDYKTAYQEALREAFNSIEALNYSNKEVIVTGTPDLNVKPEREMQKTTAISSSENKVSPLTPAIPIEEELNVTPDKPKTPLNEASVMAFTRDGRNYFLKKTDKGFNIFQEGMTDPFASLISSVTGKNFVYSSMTSKGMAHLDNEGNLFIEILKEDNSLDTIIYTAKGQ